MFTGKGGVGKTTCAAATAIRAAEMGYSTLVMSSDPAHSLADALELPVGPEPEEVLPNLFAQEVDMYYSMKKHWGNIRELLLTVFKWQGVDRIAAEELAAIPGMGEATALLWLDQLYQSKKYDLIVVDSAPTGETLTFLSLPQATEWWLTRAFPFQSKAIQTLGFAVRKTTGIPLDKGYEELKSILDKLRKIQAVLSKADVTSVRLVMNPERMVIEEAKRAYTYLQLYGYGVDSVIVNRVMPAEVLRDAAWKEYVEAQAKYLEEIKSTFGPLPMMQLPHRRREVFGTVLLSEIGRALYEDKDPLTVFYREQTYKIEPEGDTMVLKIRLPLGDAAKPVAQRFGDHLTIQIESQRRSYMLPRFLTYYALGESTWEDGWLNIRFLPQTTEDSEQQGRTHES